MSDVFISYSHKDTEFVRSLVKPIEDEGFTVWWDHTIPPGKTWDDVIARGIREAKACIIVWTPDSVVSDWVKEEATIAKEGGKYLPIQIGVDQPPMGFRRIQSANLSRWNGNAQDPQWRMLIKEVANLVRDASTSSTVASPTLTAALNPRPQAPVAPPAQHRSNTPIVAALVGVAIIIGAAVVWGFWYASQSRIARAGAVPITSTPPSDSADQPVDAQQAVASPPQNSRAAPTASSKRAHASASGSIIGVWRGWYHLDTDSPGLHTPLTGTFQAGGGMIGQSAGRTSYWHWEQSGSNAQWTNGSVTYTASLNGNHMTGTISYEGHTGNFEATR